MIVCEWIVRRFWLFIIVVSEIFCVEDLVAFPKDFVSFEPQIILLPDITHVKQLLGMLLEVAGLVDCYYCWK